MTYIDTNVFIDLLDPASDKHESCLERLIQAKAAGPVIISNIVYSEASVGMADEAAMNSAVQALALARSTATDAALFRAGRAFKQYKDENQGPKNNVLPDFLIGAEAEIAGAPLITSDDKRMSAYFPNLEVIKP